MASILVIEDDPIYQDLTTGVLAQAGHQVELREDGQSGLEAARELCPELIISDINMPGMSGYEVLGSLQENPSTAAIPFIFLSAKTDVRDFRYALGLGADDYVTKPFGPTELIKTVEVRLQRQEALQAVMGKMQGRIVETIPHEFLTPLNAVLGFSNLLLAQIEAGEFPDPLQLEDNLESIRDAGERLLRSVSNYVTYMQIQNGSSTSPQARGPSDVSGLEIQDAAEEVLQRHDRASDAQFSCESARIGASADTWRKVLVETLDNACRYSRKGSPIHITCQKSGEYAFLTVTDAGMGMTAQQIAMLDAFVQFGKEQVADRGLGLGLALARRLLRDVGGSLEIESEPQVGTTCRMLWPVVEEQAAAPAPAEARL